LEREVIKDKNSKRLETILRKENYHTNKTKKRTILVGSSRAQFHRDVLSKHVSGGGKVEAQVLNPLPHLPHLPRALEDFLVHKLEIRLGDGPGQKVLELIENKLLLL
jgi:hypothetical protein